ncbi:MULTISPECIES: potassium channel family protein [Thermotoga]|jgi:trk system potassium uptake protein TrkA|nr:MULTISPECIES: TrkA family potassium uptake protein [Thermotoga]AJG41554.1 potassium transporter TrkA [Thermotoga sp. RQ7]KFZ21278.1 TrkA-N domain protein precursor [Thermotoga neapolitana LA10]HBF10302.1 TrkA family potassium uptake protein [Thermotoga neapolitana]
MTRGKSKYIVVFGCGRLGASIANLASSLGHSVVVVDRNEYAFHRLNSEFSGFTVVGDAAEYETLKESGMEKADMVFAFTNDDSTNFFIAMNARHMFGVKKVIARVYDPEKIRIFEEHGIDTICPAILMMEKVKGYVVGSDQD